MKGSIVQNEILPSFWESVGTVPNQDMVGSIFHEEFMPPFEESESDHLTGPDQDVGAAHRMNIDDLFCRLCANKISFLDRKDMRSASSSKFQFKNLYKIDLDDDPNFFPKYLHSYCRQSLNRGAIVMCAGPEDFNHLLGISQPQPQEQRGMKRKLERRKPGPKKEKKILSLKMSTGKNREFRKSVGCISKVIEQKCLESDESVVEFCYFQLHKSLAMECRFLEAKALIEIYESKFDSYSMLDPTHSFANQIQAGRSQRQQLSLRNYLKQQTGRTIFPARQALEKIGDSYKPRSTEFKIYDRDDSQLRTILKHFKPPVRPENPALKGKTKQEKDFLKGVFKEEMKTYKRLLEPKSYKNNFPTYPESPVPDMIAITEDYENCLAAAVKDLGSRIVGSIKKFNQQNSAKILPGLIDTKVR